MKKSIPFYTRWLLARIDLSNKEKSCINENQD